VYRILKSVLSTRKEPHLEKEKVAVFRTSDDLLDAAIVLFCFEPEPAFEPAGRLWADGARVRRRR